MLCAAGAGTSAATSSSPTRRRTASRSRWHGAAMRPSRRQPRQIDRIDRARAFGDIGFVADDVADDMAVRCPAHPAAVGTVRLRANVGARQACRRHPSRAITGRGRSTPEAMRLVIRCRDCRARDGQRPPDEDDGGPGDVRRADRPPERALLRPYLEQELEAAAARRRARLSVIMLDLDHFKAFNDAYGHPAGDEALRTFAARPGRSIRASDVAAPYGGEEFIVALRHAGLGGGRPSQRTSGSRSSRWSSSSGPADMAHHASLGVASTEHHVADMKALVAIADAALYRAKEGGRNRVEIAPDRRRPHRPFIRRASRRPPRRRGRSRSEPGGNLPPEICRVQCRKWQDPRHDHRAAPAASTVATASPSRI